MSEPASVFQTVTQRLEAAPRGPAACTDALAQLLDHIDRVNPALNAIVTLDRAGALAAAESADQQPATPDRPLHGIPITLKDAWSVRGMRSTGGYLPMADYVPDEDATIVGRLRAAGAIIVGKTNVPTLSADTQTDNEIFGRTNNPWHTGCTPGGSSGGSAAAVASGMSPLDIGSDIAGSIRIPAHYCGVYGLKPTEHRTSTAGHIPPLPGSPRGVKRFSVAGPIARSIDDLELALRIIAGPDRRYVDLPPVPLPDRPPTPDIRSLRIAWIDRFGHVPITTDTQAVLEDSAAALARHGATVMKLLPPGLEFPAIWENYGLVYWAVVAGGLPPEIDAAEAEGAGFTPDSPDAFSRGAGRAVHASLRLYGQAMIERDRYVNALEAFFDDWDVLICPVSATPAIPHMPHMTPVTVNGQTINYFERGTYYCIPFSLTGHPVVVIPAGMSDDGLPIGIQIVGRRWDEIRLLAHARAIDAILKGYQRPPGLG